jgi:ribosomal subunit interface protein
MNVRFTGRHVGIPEADRDYAERKIGSLVRYHRGLRELEVRATLDGGVLETVELEASLGRHRVVAEGRGEGFRPALDGAVEALKRQLLKDKEKRVGRRRRAPRRAEGRSPR